LSSRNLMAKGAKRGRVRDKWKDKKWIIVNAPTAFGGNAINYVPISDIDNTKGRVIENTLYDIYKQDPNQHQIKVFLQIDKVTTATASTIFVGHEYAKEYLRSLVRRGSSMITFIKNYTTTDGYTFRISIVTFTQRRINTSGKHEIRLFIDKMLNEKISQLPLDQFIQEVTLGGLSKELLTEAKKIAFIRHLGIKKSKLISTPESRSIYEAKQIETPTITA
jgi:small subunit ribosomal protein S3Ae